MPTPTLRQATSIMRSYKAALSASSNNPEALTSWVERESGEHSRNRDFDQETAIALLSYMQHPLFPPSSLSTEEAAWSQMMATAEQTLQYESTWSSNQIQQHHNTVFVRMFSSDVSWIQQWTQANGDPLHPNQYLFNDLVEDYISESGSNQAHMRHQT
jgi:hypothetical protein